MTASSDSSSFKSMSFDPDLDTTDPKIHDLFNHLMRDLAPMDKHGPMSGRCGPQTEQMEIFLRENFDFENIPGEYLVDGVRSFRVGRPPSLPTLDANTKIDFPSVKHDHPFEMTIDELRKWQQSYVVYAAEDSDLSIDKEFLARALQGQSADGEEAFRMKFVIRISTCPILMEFDGCVIPRKLDEDWPHRIKLVSVTGVDFAGRKHDINDIFTYVTNWRDIYALDKETGQPLVYGGRDFYAVRNVRAALDEKRLYDDLIRMARMRLRGCDHEGVQIVVETGIGLGVFAGRQIGIDHLTRSLSARAVKQVLEEDGHKYSHILAVVFAMPIFELDESTSTYNYFIDAFQRDYRGRVPVLIADQDMHRLTVAIAKRGFNVSELNPADSHGVFGEYWQNRGPAVEEKLALTTVGLLVQHHLFNRDHVLNPQNYKLIRTTDEHRVTNVVSTVSSYFTSPQVAQELQKTVSRWLQLFILMSLGICSKEGLDDETM